MKKFENSHTNASGVFPDTLAIDASGPSTTDGTEYIAGGINEEWGWIQALLNEAGITPSGVTETKAASDILDGIKTIIGGSKIQPITASIAANALTITLNPTFLDFRSATLGSGAVNTRILTAAISIIVSSGSTLGTVSAIQSRLAVIAIDNAGTVELAVVNLAGGNNLDETTRITTVAEGGAGAADSANAFYSDTLRTNVPFRVVGYIESTQATAGAWATAPSTIQGYGGQAFAAMSSIGYGQTWQGVTRTAGTTYYNTTGKPISINATLTSTLATSAQISITQNGAAVVSFGSSGDIGRALYISAIIPPGASYVLSTITGVPTSVATITELR